MVKKVFCLGIFIFLFIGVFESVHPKELESEDEIIQAIQAFRKERDIFFKNAPNFPLEDSDKVRFKGLNYFSIDPKYRFEGEIEKYIININNPKYYATFLNKQRAPKAIRPIWQVPVFV